jgi:hypothetical protein
MLSNRSDRYSSDEVSGDSQGVIVDFSAPLGSTKSARLVIASETRGLELKADPSDIHLYRARFWQFAPRVQVNENVVLMEYGNFPLLEQPAELHAPLAQVSLNDSIPWEIELHKEVSYLNADLQQLQLRSLDILSLASHIHVTLSKPAETIYIYISGGIRHSTIQVPPNEGIRVRVSGGANNLVFENQRLGSLGDETSLESHDFNSTAGRYDICISGGARDLTIVRQS